MCTSHLGCWAFSLVDQSEWTVPSEEILLIVRSNFLIYHVTNVTWHTLSKSEGLYWLNLCDTHANEERLRVSANYSVSLTVKLNALYTLLQNKKKCSKSKILYFIRRLWCSMSLVCLKVKSSEWSMRLMSYPPYFGPESGTVEVETGIDKMWCYSRELNLRFFPWDILPLNWVDGTWSIWYLTYTSVVS